MEGSLCRGGLLGQGRRREFWRGGLVDNFLSVLAAPFKFPKGGNLISESLKSGRGVSWCVDFSWKEGGWWKMILAVQIVCCLKIINN